VALTDCSARPRPLIDRTPINDAAPKVAAVAADDAAVPPTEMIMPRRRPSLSTIGPTSSTTMAVPTLTRVETRRA
jgi:hypothetical protein